MRPVAPYAGAWIEIALHHWQSWKPSVAPYAGAWIEISVASSIKVSRKVAPYAGAWIEIAEISAPSIRLLSLPTRERGLKYSIVLLHGK